VVVGAERHPGPPASPPPHHHVLADARSRAGASLSPERHHHVRLRHREPREEGARRLPFWAQVLIGLAVGIVLGFLARTFSLDWLTELLNTVGTIFVQLLRVIVVPLVLTALIVSITQLRHVANAARLAVQTLVWFAITALVSVVIGIGLGVLTNPGASATIGTEGAKAVRHAGHVARLPEVARPVQLPRPGGLLPR
jgi:hypothetical protein